MEHKIFHQVSKYLFLLVLAFALGITIVGNNTQAASNVVIKEIDYENLTLTLEPGGNSIIYYSTNKSTWNEIESCDGANGTKIIDIAWTSLTSDTKLYFKGNEATNVVMCTVPKITSNLKAKYVTRDGTVSLSNYGDAKQFYWRKSTDYNWKLVDIDENSTSYKAFLKELEPLRVMGCTIYVRTAQIKGDGNNTGCRPSKEVKVAIKKRSAMPSIKLNIKKLTFNTSVKMEYRLVTSTNDEKWKPCDSKMKLRDISSKPLADSPSAVTIEFRKAATDSVAESKVKRIVIPAQKKGPAAEDVQNYYQSTGSGTSEKKSFVFNIKGASAEKPYEYVMIKAGKTFDESTASWKTLKNDKIKKFSQKAAPEGSVLYVRYKGVAENEKKNIKLELPSAYTQIKISYGEKKE